MGATGGHDLDNHADIGEATADEHRLSPCRPRQGPPCPWLLRWLSWVPRPDRARPQLRHILLKGVEAAGGHDLSSHANAGEAAAGEHHLAPCQPQRGPPCPCCVDHPRAQPPVAGAAPDGAGSWESLRSVTLTVPHFRWVREHISPSMHKSFSQRRFFISISRQVDRL